MHIYSGYCITVDTTLPKITVISLMWVKARKTQISFNSVSLSFCLSFSLSLQGPGKKKKRAEEKKATVCCSTFEASLSGLAAWSCVSKPRRAFHPLCCPRCVQCTEALCVEGDDTSHSVFCPELGDGGGLGWVGGGGRTTEGDKKQTYRGPRLFKAAKHKGL